MPRWSITNCVITAPKQFQLDLGREEILTALKQLGHPTLRFKVNFGDVKPGAARRVPQPRQRSTKDEVTERALGASGSAAVSGIVWRRSSQRPQSEGVLNEMKMPGNMQAMMKQAQQMQEKMQAEIALIRVEGSAGGGMVTVKMDGHKNVLGVKIDPEVAGDVEMLQDLVVAACNDAVKKVDDESQRKMGGMLGGMGLPPGLVLDADAAISPNRSRGSSPNSRRLPGIGQKSAQRIAFHIMRASRDDAAQLARGDSRRERQAHHLRGLQQHRDGELCQYCRDPQRDQKVVCVVEDPNNIVGIEVTRQFNGLYHVLGGALSPLARHRPGAIADQEPGRPHREGRRRRNHRRDESDGRRRSDGGLSVEASEAARDARSRGSRWACRSAAIWNSPTK